MKKIFDLLKDKEKMKELIVYGIFGVLTTIVSFGSFYVLRKIFENVNESILNAISIILACVTRLINIFDNIQFIKIIGCIFAGFTYSAIANIIINTFIHILRVFYVNFYKDESYLTHTLPVTKSQLLTSKYLSALIVILSSFAGVLISLFIMLYSQDFVTNLRAIIEYSISGFNIKMGVFILIFAILIFLQICAMLCMGFSAIIKANTYNNKRILMGIIWFVIYYFGAMLITLLITILAFALSGNINALFSASLSQNNLITLIIISILTYLIYTILHCLIASKMFNKGVNVD